MMKKVAIIFRGGVGRAYGKLGHNSTNIYAESPYINYLSVEKSIRHHIINYNPDYKFDTFIHCWNEDLQESLVELYKPKKYLFESNTPYREEIERKLFLCGHTASSFGEVSVSLSIKKGIELVESYCEETGNEYDLVIFLRPDYLYWDNMNLKDYDEDKVYGTQYGPSDGESHYVMNFENMKKFKNLYDSINYINPPLVHKFIAKYIVSFAANCYKDKFYTGVDHESVRKLRYNIENETLKEEDLYKYGLTLSEIYSYNAD
ncbi:hypothetical protein EBS02_12560 [bacterium]|nr:hypothetical protein [bacterium]